MGNHERQIARRSRSNKASNTKQDLVAEFFDKLVKAIPKYKGGYSECGSRVMPAIEIFKNLKTQEERMAYQNALEKMLRSKDKELREFAVVVCLVFLFLEMQYKLSLNHGK